MTKTVITVAPTGAWPNKEDNPNVPLTPEEIAEDVYQCYQAGASVAHLHMRDEEGKGTMDKERFKKTATLIKERCDIVLNLTTSGDLNATEETRMAHLKEIKPEMASFDAGSMNWMYNSVFLNHPKFLEKLGKTMKEHNIKPEIEVFHAGMLYDSLYYKKQGILEEPIHYQFVLGTPGGMGASVDNLLYLKNLLPENTTWSAFGVGRAHIPILYTAIALGGHVRVGMEDNVYYSKGRLAKSNAEFVERAVRVIKEANREVATPEDAREILNLKQ
ncbi:MAG: 3-keto-5-aminohexanoate cleavage protein [Firmicutes bacterium]|nr:3-keto-5-aminohexanoate cleavage protein [Bacillota bacterium]